MSGTAPARLERVFGVVVSLRWLIVALYAILLPLGLYLALQVETDNSIDRLVVPNDTDYQDTKAFQKIFPEGEQVVLLAQAPDPFGPDVVKKVGEIEHLISQVPRVSAFSILDLYERVGASRPATTPAREDFRAFATGTRLFARMGLAGSDFLGISLDLKVAGPEERDETLAAIDRTLGPIEAAPAP